MPLDYELLSLPEIIEIQIRLSETLKRRFERHVALMFTDIVGSTQYFARFGDQKGRALQQRHLELLRAAVTANGGRIVDTAGDGAFTTFPALDAAARAAIDLQRQIRTNNLAWSDADRLSVRLGLHWGSVLTDGTVVTGDSVNFCSRIAGTAAGSEIRLTRAAFLELAPNLRLRCRETHTLELKGIAGPVQVMVLEWADASRFPEAVRIEETGEVIPLPADRDTVTFGRMRAEGNGPGNDVVLSHPDGERAVQISRWHFELRRGADGFLLRSVTDQTTEVDGRAINTGEQVPIQPGTVVAVGEALTLTFLRERNAPVSGGAHATVRRKR